MRIPAIMLVVLLAQIGWKGDQKLPRPPEVAEAMVDSMAAEYYEAKFTCYPALATLKGVPGFDGKLSTYSQRSVFGLLTRIRNLGRDLATLDEDSLSMGKWTEFKALLADMAAERYRLENLEWWRSRPTLYVDACVEGIVYLYLQQRGRDMPADLSPRLQRLPDVVKHARRNITSPSELHCLVASERLEALAGWLETLPEQPGVLEIEAGLLEQSIASLNEFRAFVDSISLEADLDFAMKYDDYLILSEARSMISDMPEDIRAYASRLLEDLDEELGSPPQDSPAEGGGPRPAGLQDLETRMAAAREALRQNEFPSLPAATGGNEPVGLKLLELPEALVELCGEIVYLEPGPDAGTRQAASLHISPAPAEPGAGPDGIIWSEALPGRHLQTAFAITGSSPVRRMRSDIFTSNGWTLYCQEAMARSGLGGEEALKQALERKRFYAAGTVAAVSLLLGDFTLDAAADFMVEQTGISEAHARRLAVEYALEPEHAISYIIGDRQIHQIKDEVSRILGEDFSLMAFHESLLASGRLPLYLLRNNLVSESVGRR